jgi:hypothetical protein
MSRDRFQDMDHVDGIRQDQNVGMLQARRRRPGVSIQNDARPRNRRRSGDDGVRMPGQRNLPNNKTEVRTLLIHSKDIFLSHPIQQGERTSEALLPCFSARG